MILTDYYRFEKLSGQRSKMRIDCTASTRSYGPLSSRHQYLNDRAGLYRPVHEPHAATDEQGRVRRLVEIPVPERQVYIRRVDAAYMGCL